MSKYALIFPGIGYHSDKPLLYYGKKLAREFGYEIIEVSYSGFEQGIQGNREKMMKAFEHAYRQSEQILKEYSFCKDDELLVISKSIGTAVAAFWQQKEQISPKNIYFTPVEETFQFIRCNSGIVFHGTNDPWARTENVKQSCKNLELPLFLTEGANHSLEIGDMRIDLSHIVDIMKICFEYVSGELK
ncbi:MAG: alpha/beta hydrolase [Bacillota bacterium]|nr:alpha/beta hydrolase [Bacillota bacterium]